LNFVEGFGLSPKRGERGVVFRKIGKKGVGG